MEASLCILFVLLAFEFLNQLPMWGAEPSKSVVVSEPFVVVWRPWSPPRVMIGGHHIAVVCPAPDD